MLTEDDIRRALHAGRVLPLRLANPHGPLGLEQLAAEVARRRKDTQPHPSSDRVRRPIELPVQTWEKLHALAEATSQAAACTVSAAELAAAIIEQHIFETGH